MCVLSFVLVVLRLGPVHSAAHIAAIRVQAQLDDDRKRELHSVIQAHFKEWLLSSGNMRQVRVPESLSARICGSHQVQLAPQRPHQRHLLRWAGV
jgi:hypothetical protein